MRKKLRVQKTIKINPAFADCPICTKQMRNPPSSNSVSRYVLSIYICSECGVREALEGQIWSPKAMSFSRIMTAQHRWLVHHNEAV